MMQNMFIAFTEWFDSARSEHTAQALSLLVPMLDEALVLVKMKSGPRCPKGNGHGNFFLFLGYRTSWFAGLCSHILFAATFGHPFSTES